jgi:hypothetical protein
MAVGACLFLASLVWLAVIGIVKLVRRPAVA